MLRPLYIRGFGDVHNGHNNTSASKIQEELKAMFPYGDKKLGMMDILVLEGDWYDKLLPNNHYDNYVTEQSIYYLLRWVKEHDVTFLIVDGTPLHDAGQIQKFTHINHEAKINADLILVDEIDIRYIPKHDIHVLFVPDRPRTTADETYQLVLKKMEDMGLEYVDMAVMHGCFQYQLPKLAPEHKHKEELYEKIVKGPIIIGHIHSHSTHGKIIAPGSFSRLSHGEEEPKGLVDIHLQTNHEFQAKFIENKLATIYKTVDVTGLNLEESLKRIYFKIKDIPSYSYVRIVCEQNHPLSIDKAFTQLKLNNADIHFTIKVKNDQSVVADKDDVFKATQDEYVPLIINKHNVSQLIVEKAIEKSYPKEIIEQIPTFLSNLGI